MDKNRKKFNIKSLEEDSSMEAVQVNKYNKQKFLFELEESLKEVKEMKKNKKKNSNSSWKDLFNTEDK